VTSLRCWPLLIALVGCDGGGLPPADSGTDGPQLVGILVSPESVVVPLGATVQLEATGLTTERTTMDLTHVASWGSSAPGVAAVSDALDHEGELRADAVGTSVVWAESAGVRSADVRVQVTDATLLGLSVTPAAATVAVGEGLQVRATAAFSDGQRSDASSQVQWITSNPHVVTVEAGGRATARATGHATVHAEWQGERSEEVALSVVNGAPDLRVAELRGETSPDGITLTAVVANDGDVGAAEVWVDVFVDPASTPSLGELGAYYGNAPYVDAGGTAQLAFQFDLSPGAHQLYVLVDSERQIDESDEDNNGLGAGFTVSSGGSSLPNLNIAYFDVIADVDSVYYVVDVFNSGAAAAGAFYVDAFVDRASAPPIGSDGDTYVQVSGVAPGMIASADFLVARHCAPCTSWLLIDSYNTVQESNEADNVAGPMYVFGTAR